MSGAKFRKRPVVIEAAQFDGHNDPPGVFRRHEDNTPYVVTIHDQRCYLSPGDWIIAEPDGVHHYPCKPDIFAATYEPASAVDPRAAAFTAGYDAGWNASSEGCNGEYTSERFTDEVYAARAKEALDAYLAEAPK